MQRGFAFASIVTLVALCASGCATTASNDLRTSGFYVSYSLTQDSETADYVARASYRVSASNGNLVELSDGEAVYVNSVLLSTKTKVAGIDINYSQTVPKGAATYTFDFRRSDNTNAPLNVAPPEAFTITSAPLSGTYTTAMYTLTWTPGTAGGKMKISAGSDQSGCNVLSIDQDLADNGSYTFAGDKLKGAGALADCTYTLTVEKTVTAAVGAPFKGGSATSTTKRFTTLHVTP